MLLPWPLCTFVVVVSFFVEQRKNTLPLAHRQGDGHSGRTDDTGAHPGAARAHCDAEGCAPQWRPSTHRQAAAGSTGRRQHQSECAAHGLLHCGSALHGLRHCDVCGSRSGYENDE